MRRKEYIADHGPVMVRCLEGDTLSELIAELQKVEKRHVLPILKEDVNINIEVLREMSEEEEGFFKFLDDAGYNRGTQIRKRFVE